MAQELVDWVYGAEEILGAANAAFQEIPGE
jgi:hypothetical protein